MVNKIFKNKWIMPIGIIIGASLGYIYWNQVGCLTGTCPASASPIMNIIAGSAISYLLVSTIQGNLKSN